MDTAEYEVGLTNEGANMPVLRVTWFEGKNAEAKAAVAHDITKSIVERTGTAAEHIYVIFEDVAASDWAGGGKLFGQVPDANSG